MKLPSLLILTALITHCPSAAQQSPSAKSTPARSSDTVLVRQLINEDLGIRSFAFAEVIHAATGKEVQPFDAKCEAHQAVLNAISTAITAAISKLNSADSPIKKLRRINEASRYFEDELLRSLSSTQGLRCSIPKNTQGREQRSGYPDLRIKHLASGCVFYLDPKLYEAKSRASSLRTFYFEPKQRTMKINDDAVHLLLGISHDGVDGDWTFKHWELIDLHAFRVRLKAEFQASNRDLYRKHLIIKDSTRP